MNYFEKVGDETANSIEKIGLLKEGGNLYPTRKEVTERSIKDSENGWMTIELTNSGSPERGEGGLFDFGVNTITGSIIPPGRTLLIEEIFISSSLKCKLQFQWSGMTGQEGMGSTASGDYIRPIIGESGITIKVNDFLIKYRNAFFVNLRKVYSANPKTDPIDISITFKYRYVDAARGLDVEHNMLVIGTSISNGTGATVPENTYVQRFLNYLSDVKGYDIGLTNRAVSGSWSVQHENKRKFPYARYSDLPKKPSIILYEHGANDIGNAVQAAVFASNVTAMAKHCKKLWPDAIFMCLSTPGYSLGLPGSHNTLMDYRNTNKQAIQAFNSEKIRFVDETYAWDETTQGSTYTTDNVHPNDAGHNLIAQGLISHWESNNLSL